MKKLTIYLYGLLHKKYGYINRWREEVLSYTKPVFILFSF